MITVTDVQPILSLDPDRDACLAKGYAALEALQQKHPGAESLQVCTYTVNGFPAPDGQVFDLYAMVIIVALPWPSENVI